MDYTTIITGAISALGGGVITRLLTSRRDNFQLLFDMLKEENEKLKADQEKDRKMIQELNSKVNEQALQIILLESAHFDHPFPVWLKSIDGTMLSLNKAYEEVFLTPKGKSMSDYIGRKDADVWGEKAGSHFWKNDLKVITNQKRWIGQEPVEINGHTEMWNILKYPRMSGNDVIGVAGMAFPKVFENNIPNI